MKRKVLSAVMLLPVCASVHAGFMATGSGTRQIRIEQRRILKEVEAPTGKYFRFNDQA